jgi:hypothetical protein
MNSVKNPYTAILDMPVEATEYPFTFPQFTKRIMFWMRNPGIYLNYAWHPGHVATPTDPYSQLLPGVMRQIENFEADGPITCYFATPTGSGANTLQLEFWT